MQEDQRDRVRLFGEHGSKMDVEVGTFIFDCGDIVGERIDLSFVFAPANINSLADISMVEVVHHDTRTNQTCSPKHLWPHESSDS